MISLAIFDMAHTTVNDRDEVYRVLREATGRQGAEYTEEQFRQWMGTEKKWAIRNLLEIGGLEATEELVEQTWDWFRAELRRTYTEQPPVALDGVEEMFAILRERNIRIALTTGFNRETVDLILDAMGWEIGQTVDASAAGDEVEAGRPEPFLIQKVMGELEVTDPATVISLGDTSADVLSAQRAGVTSVGVLSGHLSREQFAELNADHVLDSAADLPALLAELNR
ncbi:HAD hydrolase-like protein [Corynebacterium sp. YIM 101645]|uniref:HAD hydrolase-like protein n=1 Tax=Corynebacterium lemuris TaxID=1859292 RepID=A0ABT2FYS3_9CORY|nr:HAD hydrolase-like protein [Corynebacterium lemuris]MCS5480159.1 HAD hydrolase-like protein [Corynebacterium lemuris]